MTILHTLISEKASIARINEVLSNDTINIDAKGEGDATALHVAIEEKYPEAALLLIDKGCDINAVDADGQTALYYAVNELDMDNMRIIHHLLQNGANVTHANSLGCTPLHLAVARSDKKLSAAFLEKGADINAVADRNGTPLHWAIDHHNLEMVNFLLVYGANGNQKTLDGMTPFCSALYEAPQAVLERLLQQPHINFDVDNKFRGALYHLIMKRKEISDELKGKIIRLSAPSDMKTWMNESHKAALYSQVMPAELDYHISKILYGHRFPNIPVARIQQYLRADFEKQSQSINKPISCK